jgi:hypothetical protein
MMEAIHSSETSFLQEPHGITSQNMTLFIVNAVKTSNLTQFSYLLSHEEPQFFKIISCQTENSIANLCEPRFILHFIHKVPRNYCTSFRDEVHHNISGQYRSGSQARDAPALCTKHRKPLARKLLEYHKRCGTLSSKCHSTRHGCGSYTSMKGKFF